MRDELLGRPAVDTDIAVAGDALGHGRTIAAAARGAFVVLDAGRGVGRVAWPAPDRRTPITLDIARLTGPDISADLKDRDFTVNAMAVPLSAGAVAPDVIIDPTSGLADLGAGLVRMTSAAALESDPLRLLRGPRIAALLGFRLEAATADAIRAGSRRAGEPAGERIAAEMFRVLDGPRTRYGLGLLAELRLLVALGLCPRGQDELGPAVASTLADWFVALGVPGYGDDDGPRRRSRGRGGRRATAESPGPTVPRRSWRGTAAPAAPPGVLHGLREGLVRHLEEPMRGGRRRSQLVALAALTVGSSPHGTQEIATRLRLARRETEALLAVATAVATPPAAAAGAGPRARRSAHVYFRAMGAAGVDGALVLLARGLLAGRDKEMAIAEALLHAWFVEHQSVVAPPAIVSGNDLKLALDLEEGPGLGLALRAVLEAQAAGEVSTVEQALALARRVALAQG